MRIYHIKIPLSHGYHGTIIGFAVHKGYVNGAILCYMFNTIIAKMPLPIYLSSDNDPLFLFHRWQANLRILEIQEIKTLPGVPISHPFVERLIKSIRHELLDRILFWNAFDLQHKLNNHQAYFNNIRSHQSLNALTPSQIAHNTKRALLISPFTDGNRIAMDHFNFLLQLKYEFAIYSQNSPQRNYPIDSLLQFISTHFL